MVTIPGFRRWRHIRWKPATLHPRGAGWHLQDEQIHRRRAFRRFIHAPLVHVACCRHLSTLLLFLLARAQPRWYALCTHHKKRDAARNDREALGHLRPSGRLHPDMQVRPACPAALCSSDRPRTPLPTLLPAAAAAAAAAAAHAKQRDARAGLRQPPQGTRRRRHRRRRLRQARPPALVPSRPAARPSRTCAGGSSAQPPPLEEETESGERRERERASEREREGERE